MKRKKITQKEWNETPKDYKSVINGKPYKLFLEEKRGTVLTPVVIVG